MTKVAFTTDFQRFPASQLPAAIGPNLNHDAFLKRMEWLSARRNGVAKLAPMLSPPHPDADILRVGEALENAWRYEIAAMMVMRKLNTPEVAAIAKASRAATEAIVKRIESYRALTRGGMKVKLRAILWRRDGEPLQDGVVDDDEAACDDADDRELVA
jgi:hypothetical protein